MTPYGLCLDISAYDYTEDYRRPGPSSAYPVHYNYFPGTNTTYCALDDANCASCKAGTFLTQVSINPSTFCVGINNCVCVAICESEDWRDETLTRLIELEPDENVAIGCEFAENSTAVEATSSSESATHLDSRPKNKYAVDDECMWYQNQTYCGVPRTCYDCLNTALYDGTVSWRIVLEGPRTLFLN